MWNNLTADITDLEQFVHQLLQISYLYILFYVVYRVAQKFGTNVLHSLNLSILTN